MNESLPPQAVVQEQAGQGTVTDSAVESRQVSNNAGEKVNVTWQKGGGPVAPVNIEVTSGVPSPAEPTTQVIDSKFLTEPLPVDGGTIEVKSDATPQPAQVDKVEPGDYLGGN